MSGRPASIRSRDVKQIIIGAKRAGADRVEFRVGTMPVIVYPGKESEPEAVAIPNEWLEGDDAY